MSQRLRPILRFLRDLGVAVAVAGAAWLVLHLVARERQRGGGGVLPVGAPAPAFALGAVEGGGLDLESLRGRPAVLTFWATWCGTCVDELPALEQVHRRSQGRYRIVTVSAEPAATLRAFLASRPDLSFPVLVDDRGLAHEAYRVDRVPMTVILDAQGRVVHDFTGEADPDILLAHLERLDARDR